MSEQIEFDESKCDETTISQPVSAVREGAFPVIVAHPEAWTSSFAQNLVTELQDGPGILLNFIDEAHQHGADHWQNIRPEMKTIPGRLRLFLEPGSPTLAMSATLTKAECETLSENVGFHEEPTVLGSDPVQEGINSIQNLN